MTHRFIYTDEMFYSSSRSMSRSKRKLFVVAKGCQHWAWEWRRLAVVSTRSSSEQSPLDIDASGLLTKRLV